MGLGGTLGVAELTFPDNSHSEDVVTFYYADGSSAKIKHEVETKGGTQASQSYVLNDKGEWEKSRVDFICGNGPQI